MEYRTNGEPDLTIEVRSWLAKQRVLVQTYGQVVEALAEAMRVGLIGSWMAECVCRDMDRSLYAFEHPDELLARVGDQLGPPDGQ